VKGFGGFLLEWILKLSRWLNITHKTDHKIKENKFEDIFATVSAIIIGN
jgi:hypothetical protein